MKIKQTSWHYRLYKTFFENPPKTLCTYLWSLSFIGFAGTFISLILGLVINILCTNQISKVSKQLDSIFGNNLLSSIIFSNFILGTGGLLLFFAVIYLLFRTLPSIGRVLEYLFNNKFGEYLGVSLSFSIGAIMTFLPLVGAGILVAEIIRISSTKTFLFLFNNFNYKPLEYPFTDFVTISKLTGMGLIFISSLILIGFIGDKLENWARNECTPLEVE